MDELENEESVALDEAMSILEADEASGDPAPERQEEHASAPAAEDVEDPADEPVIQDQEDEADPHTAVIEPPGSWNADAREHFRQLPENLQRIIAEREAEQQRTFNRHINEATAKKQAAEAEATAVANERQRLKQQLDLALNYANTFDPVLMAAKGTDWDKLAQDDPAQFIVRKQQYDSRVAQINAMVAERQRIAQQETDSFLQAQAAKLAATIPEWRNPAERQKLEQQMHVTLRDDYGFTDDELGRLADARLYQVGRDAMLWRQHQKAQRAAQQKRTAPAPKVQRPGASSGVTSKSEKLKQLDQRAQKSGSMEDTLNYVLAAIGDN